VGPPSEPTALAVASNSESVRLFALSNWACTASLVGHTGIVMCLDGGAPLGGARARESSPQCAKRRAACSVRDVRREAWAWWSACNVCIVYKSYFIYIIIARAAPVLRGPYLPAGPLSSSSPSPPFAQRVCLLPFLCTPPRQPRLRCWPVGPRIAACGSGRRQAGGAWAWAWATWAQSTPWRSRASEWDPCMNRVVWDNSWGLDHGVLSRARAHAPWMIRLIEFILFPKLRAAHAAPS
jgi:hypothetical protein